MPIRGTILLAWTLIYGYSALLYLLAFSRRRVEPELASFGYLCGAFAVIAYASVRQLADPTPEGLLFTGPMAEAGRFLLGAAFVSLCASLTRVPHKLVLLTCGWATVGLALVAVGAYGAVERGAYTPQPLGRALLNFGLVLAGAAFFYAAKDRGHDLYARRVLGAAAICFLAGVADLALPSLDALAHAGIVGVLLVHSTLITRFGDATEKLADRRAAYWESLEDLSQKHEELRETEKLAAVGELSAVIAHEVRNPLAIIKNAGSAIRRGVHGREAQRRLLDILDEETERLHRLTFELSAFAELGKPNPDECELSPLLGRCVDRARAHQATHGGPEMRFVIGSTAATVFADRDLLEGALFYLVQNAMDASPPGSTIMLETRDVDLEEGPAVEIAVIDEGEGMSPEILQKAVVPFFTTRPRGTGLALAIVKRIADDHGGHLALESEPGRGTAARLILPIAGAFRTPSYTSLVPPEPEERRPS